MRHTTGKKIALAATLLCTVSLAQADNQPGNSDAIQFGIQAGSIAGMTQACGQDISVFVTRVNEALNKLALSPTDRVQASAAFQRVLQQTQTMQTNNHTIPCMQVLQDYNTLPILRPDYQQTVIAQLHPGMPANPAGAAPQQAASTTTPPATPATTPTSSAPQLPPQQPQQVAPTNPPVNATNNNSATLQPLPQGSNVPAMPNTSTTPPPAQSYNQGGLPGSQQQQMTAAPSNPASPVAPAASMPPADVNNVDDQAQQQQIPPPAGSPDQ
jgi:hypothetical protein